MALGSVSVVPIDNMQGDFNAVERVFLYVGRTGTEEGGTLMPIDNATELTALKLGAELETTITAARQNAKSDNFACYALPLTDNMAWPEAVYAVLDAPTDLNVEAIVLCTPISEKAELVLCETVAQEILGRFAKFVTVFACVSGCGAAETWAEYIVRLGSLLTGVGQERTAVVAQLHGNNLGVIAGRLCNPAASLADSPMRVATGALIGLGESPKDEAGTPLNMATLKQLAEMRVSVPQWYAGYDGMYWGDMLLLAAEGSDFQVYENRRVIDYLARRVRILAIGKVADRRLNSTPQSIAVHQNYFARPLREASREIEIAGITMPGMIYPPEDNAILIVWTSRTSVSIAITARPYNCPKEITMYLGLDLSSQE